MVQKRGRGRPIKSEIRQNIIDILHVLGSGYGYDVYKIYQEIFPKVTMRSIYYHLKKGTQTNEFKISEIKKEKGHFSWGGEVEKTYYALGPNAQPRDNERIKFATKKLKKFESE